MYVGDSGLRFSLYTLTQSLIPTPPAPTAPAAAPATLSSPSYFCYYHCQASAWTAREGAEDPCLPSTTA